MGSVKAQLRAMRHIRSISQASKMSSSKSRAASAPAAIGSPAVVLTRTYILPPPIDPGAGSKFGLMMDPPLHAAEKSSFSASLNVKPPHSKKDMDHPPPAPPDLPPNFQFTKLFIPSPPTIPPPSKVKTNGSDSIQADPSQTTSWRDNKEISVVEEAIIPETKKKKTLSLDLSGTVGNISNAIDISTVAANISKAAGTVSGFVKRITSPRNKIPSVTNERVVAPLMIPFPKGPPPVADERATIPLNEGVLPPLTTSLANSPVAKARAMPPPNGPRPSGLAKFQAPKPPVERAIVSPHQDGAVSPYQNVDCWESEPEEVLEIDNAQIAVLHAKLLESNKGEIDQMLSSDDDEDFRRTLSLVQESAEISTDDEDDTMMEYIKPVENNEVMILGSDATPSSNNTSSPPIDSCTQTDSPGIVSTMERVKQIAPKREVFQFDNLVEDELMKPPDYPPREENGDVPKLFFPYQYPSNMPVLEQHEKERKYSKIQNPSHGRQLVKTQPSHVQPLKNSCSPIHSTVLSMKLRPVNQPAVSTNALTEAATSAPTTLTQVIASTVPTISADEIEAVLQRTWNDHRFAGNRILVSRKVPEVIEQYDPLKTGLVDKDKIGEIITQCIGLAIGLEDLKMLEQGVIGARMKYDSLVLALEKLIYKQTMEIKHMMTEHPMIHYQRLPRIATVSFVSNRLDQYARWLKMKGVIKSRGKNGLIHQFQTGVGFCKLLLEFVSPGNQMVPKLEGINAQVKVMAKAACLKNIQVGLGYLLTVSKSRRIPSAENVWSGDEMGICCLIKEAIDAMVFNGVWTLSAKTQSMIRWFERILNLIGYHLPDNCVRPPHKGLWEVFRSSHFLMGVLSVYRPDAVHLVGLSATPSTQIENNFQLLFKSLAELEIPCALDGNDFVNSSKENTDLLVLLLYDIHTKFKNEPFPNATMPIRELFKLSQVSESQPTSPQFQMVQRAALETVKRTDWIDFQTFLHRNVFYVGVDSHKCLLSISSDRKLSWVVDESEYGEILFKYVQSISVRKSDHRDELIVEFQTATNKGNNPSFKSHDDRNTLKLYVNLNNLFENTI